MIFTTYLLLIILIIGWSINPYIIKKSIGNLSYDEYLFINATLVLTVIILFHLYKYSYSQKNIFNVIKYMHKEQLLFITLSTILAITTSMTLYTLLKYNNVSYIIPQIQPCVIILSILIGYFIFKESITVKQLIGIFLIILGLFIVNYK